MHFFFTHKWLSAICIAVLLLAVFLLWQVLYITMHYTASVPAPNIPRGTETFGTAVAPHLNVVIMGDSTSIGQGATYTQGFARMSAQRLAQNYAVSMTNVGVSGARVADVRRSQLTKAVALKPDLIILAIGANDVTHLTPFGSIRTNIGYILDQLQASNPHLHIILTGSPAMGSVPRFAVPTQWLAAARTSHINAVFADVAKQKDVVLVPLAAQTGPTFKHNPKLFANDNFHPNASGYAVWQPVINQGLTQAGLTL